MKVNVMSIAIITINYNGADNTIRLLKSLSEQTDGNFRVVVVDNASSDEDYTRLQDYTNQESRIKNHGSEQSTSCFVIRNLLNLGFGGGCNTGIKEALRNGADWIVLLNNDTWVDADFISCLRAVLEAAGEGIVALPLDKGFRTAFGGKIEWLKSSGRHFSSKKNADANIGSLYAIGGGMAVQKSVFEKIGFFDEEYFLYFEDIDFAARAHRAGMPVKLVERPMVQHAGSATTKKLGSPLLLRYHYRNACYFNRKLGPWWAKMLVRPVSAFTLALQTLKITVGQHPEESRAIRNGIEDFYSNRMGRIDR